MKQQKTDQNTKRKKRLLSAAPPQEPPLDIPHGGSAAKTPYPDFDVAAPDKWAYDWDEKTRRLVIDRLEIVPSYQFFQGTDIETLEILCERLMPQDDRTPEQRIPIAPWIDQRLHQGEGDGYRYENMPTDEEAYRLGITSFDQTAQAKFGSDFHFLKRKQQDQVIQMITQESSPGAVWNCLPAKQFFRMLMKDILTNYFAHPAAWDEVGFSGPASPRGHVRRALGRRDPWEAEEQRPFSSVELVCKAEQSQGETAGGATH